MVHLHSPLLETNREEHRLNYERYRTIAMADFNGGRWGVCGMTNVEAPLLAFF